MQRAVFPEKKLSKRGRLGEGRPTKRSPEVVRKIADAISRGLNDDEAAAIAGISDLTLTTWRKDPEFLRLIKSATSQRTKYLRAFRVFFFHSPI